MQILTDNKLVRFYGTVEKGRYDADPSRDLYRITNGDEVMYAVTEGFEVHEVDALPEDFEGGHYCYTVEDGFYPDPNYKEPYIVEDEVKKQAETIASQQETIDMLTSCLLEMSELVYQ